MLWLMKDGEWAACQWRSTDMKAGGANTLQHVLKGTVSEGEEPSGSWGAAGHGPTVIWLPLRERVNQWREVQNLHFWHSPCPVTPLNECRGCTDTQVPLRNRITSHLSEFPLSWTGLGWKVISTLLLLRSWEGGSRDNACEKGPKQKPWQLL